ncbi:RNA splicing factor [Lithospermum erythrorhizon]|uniref:RNA splicing factor n=1 Tax=Lithospermum erythrorhizon TaxID=34254 RepID=A0AAV3PUQ2_LITER
MTVIEKAVSGSSNIAEKDSDYDSLELQQQQKTSLQQSNGRENEESQKSEIELSVTRTNDHVNGNAGEGFKKEMRDVESMLSKLNPMAEEFVPTLAANGKHIPIPVMSPRGGIMGYKGAAEFVTHAGSVDTNGTPNRRRRNGVGQGKLRMSKRTSMAQREDAIKRTVYVSDIDQQVTEEQLAGLFLSCGQVVDCRVCGDPNSVLRFAFVEFTDQRGARNALSLSGAVLGYYPLKVLPSKTAIAPVNPTFLPRSEDEREMCVRTIYCTNIDKKITQDDVRAFFETFCGEVNCLRLLGDYQHSTRVAFVEFVMADCAIAALNCSGAVLGTLPIRVSPSKTPVRPRAPHTPNH